ncbi:MAG: bifunctional tetrahydrofolate synthase/dihydrofolate synthase [Burkholderiaceae bacterium]
MSSRPRAAVLMMQELKTLDAWLAHIESLHAKPIDMGLARMHELVKRLGIRFECPVFVVGGTNGKGSTCSMLEAILRSAGYRVGLHTSPHLLRFNERARLDGAQASDEQLIEQFAAVEAARGDITLSYFEFTALAILRLFQTARLDAVVLEIGLGGRLDAINVIDADVAIITSVDLDHVDYLGHTREAIGLEKAHIYRTGRPAICADPQPPQSLIDYAREVDADLWLFGRDFNYSGDKQQWAYGGRSQRRAALPYPALRGANQLLNAAGAIAALEAIGARLPVSQAAVREGLLRVEIPGRFQILPGQPAIILDVAHNPHAAAVLAQNLDAMAYHPSTHAVFGMLADKDIAAVVGKIGARVDHWHVASLPGPRGTSASQLSEILRAAGVSPAAITSYADVESALVAAQVAVEPADRIVVFGSFLTVAAAMQALALQRAQRRDQT